MLLMLVLTAWTLLCFLTKFSFRFIINITYTNLPTIQWMISECDLLAPAIVLRIEIIGSHVTTYFHLKIFLQNVSTARAQMSFSTSSIGHQQRRINNNCLRYLLTQH